MAFVRYYQNQGARACGERAGERTAAAQSLRPAISAHGTAVDIALSFIRTMTVGFGVEPNLLTLVAA